MFFKLIKDISNSMKIICFVGIDHDVIQVNNQKSNLFIY